MRTDTFHNSISQYSIPDGKLQSLKWNIRKTECLELASGIAELDVIFRKGVRYGTLVEWGLPEGKNGRILPLLFLRHIMAPTEWIYPDNGTDIYAPAWASRGVDLRRVLFVKCNDPVMKLKPLFLDDAFTVIVLDSPRKLSKGALSFISAQTRINQQIVFLLRHFFLSSKRGNAFAAVRLNGAQDRRVFFTVNVIKGKQIGKIILPEKHVLTGLSTGKKANQTAMEDM